MNPDAKRGALPVADRRQTRRAGWGLARTDGRALLGVLLLGALAAATGLAGPWLLAKIIDEVQHGGGSTAVVDRLVLAIVVFAVAQLLLTRFARYAAYRFGERTLARLRERFVDRILALPTAVVERAGTGELMTRSTGDVTSVGTSLRDALPEIFLAVLQMAFILGAMFLLDPRLGLCVLVAVPLLVAVSRWYLRRARDAYLAEGSTMSELSESLASTVEGGRTVEAFRLQDRRVGAGDDRVRSAYAARVRTLVLRSVLLPGVDIAYATPAAAILLLGGVMYVDGAVQLGAVVGAALYAWQLVDPIDRVLMRLEQLQASNASLARLEGVTAAVDPAGPVPVGQQPRGAVGALPVDDRLEVSAVRYAYDGGPDVLADVDLVVRPGEHLAIVGPSGAGKSTLGRLLAGVEPPRTGSVTVGGVPVAELSAAELRRRVVLVTQEHHVFLGTLRDNLAIAAPSADDADLLRALADVDADWVATLPAGLDTELGADGVRLDAAWAQQLGLARVVLADPHTVVLDEATAQLDPTTARDTERALAAVLSGRTVIAIAHRLHTAHDADRVAVIEDGRIVELGSHDELLTSGGPYAALWHAWRTDPS